MTPLPLIAYRLATRALEPLAPRLLDARARRGKEDPVRVDERMGFTRTPRPAGDLVWLHGVSVGESLSLLPVVERLTKVRPDLTVLVTSSTVTSAQILAERLPAPCLGRVPKLKQATADKVAEHLQLDLLD